MHMLKSKQVGEAIKSVQLVAGFGQNKIQSIGANGIYFMNAQSITRR